MTSAEPRVWMPKPWLGTANWPNSSVPMKLSITTTSSASMRMPSSAELLITSLLIVVPTAEAATVRPLAPETSGPPGP